MSERQDMSETWVDGNGMAGALRELFAVDVTTAKGTCTGCGAVAPLAGAHVFTRAPGLVARCQRCGSVLLRVVRGPGRAWLDLRGVICLEIAIPEPG